jgi:hypothetical protein
MELSCEDFYFLLTLCDPKRNRKISVKNPKHAKLLSLQSIQLESLEVAFIYYVELF